MVDPARGSGLDDTDSDGLSHVSGSKTSKRGQVREGFDAHGLAEHKPDDSVISGLDELIYKRKLFKSKFK